MKHVFETNFCLNKFSRQFFRKKKVSILFVGNFVFGNLPRVRHYLRYKPFVVGLNFALEKMCAKSKGSCIFVPSYRSFLKGGEPREELFARDGLHLNGAGIDRLEACFQQALSSDSMLARVSSARTGKLALLRW